MLRYLVLFFFLIFTTQSQSETIVVHGERPSIEQMMNKVRADRTITSEEIKSKGYNFLHQLLSEEAGIHVVRSGPLGGQTSLFLHGLKSEHILVLIDGVPMNDPSSPGRSYDFSHLSLLNVDRIEIVKGPDSIHYGSDALGGVIKVWTKSKIKEWQSSVRGDGGSFKTYGLQGETRGPLWQTFSLNLAGEHYYSGGFSAASSEYPGNQEDDAFWRQAAQVKIEGRPEGLAHLTAGGKWEKSKTELDQGGGAGQDDLNYSLRQENRSYFFEMDKNISRWLSPQLQMKAASHVKIANDAKDSDNDTVLFEHYEGKTGKVALQNVSLVGEDSKFTSGVEVARESMEIEGILPERSVSTQAFLLSLDHKWEQFQFLLGGRNDQHEVFGDFQSYSVVPSYTFEHWPVSVSASWSSAFKAPTLYQLYSAFGSTALGPERARTIQLKSVLVWNAWEVEAQLFNTTVEDLIDFDFVTFRYSNQGDLRAKGGELSFRSPVDGDVSGEMSYSYTQSYDQARQRALRRPTHEVHGQVTYQRDQWSSRLSGNFVGRREDIHATDFTRISMPSYFLMHFYTAYSVKKNLKADLRVDNVLDKQYEQVHGLGTAGRSYFVGLAYDF
ncbi:MAG: TonB-dependent receptor [Bdellovibrio sp.]|nr:TonB-dependent receptor [Bdellovibrio sp.]